MTTRLRTPLNSMRMQERQYRLPNCSTTYSAATCSTALPPSDPTMVRYDPESIGTTTLPKGVGCQQPDPTALVHPGTLPPTVPHQRPTASRSWSLESGTSKVGSTSFSWLLEPVAEPPRRQSDSSLDTGARCRSHQWLGMMSDGRTAHPRRASSVEEQRSYSQCGTTGTKRQPWTGTQAPRSNPLLRPSILSPLSPLSPLPTDSSSSGCAGQHLLGATVPSSPSFHELQPAASEPNKAVNNSSKGLLPSTTTQAVPTTVAIPVPGMKNVRYPLHVPDLELPSPRSQHDPVSGLERS